VIILHESLLVCVKCDQYSRDSLVFGDLTSAKVFTMEKELRCSRVVLCGEEEFSMEWSPMVVTFPATSLPQ
jgi:hypothetical protein